MRDAAHDADSAVLPAAATMSPAAPTGTAGRWSQHGITLGLLGLLLVSTAALSLIWSHYRLFWADELFEFYTDSKPTLGAIVWGQLHASFSLEPPAYHFLLHFLERVIPSPELASRLPSVVALLVTEVCAFRLTFRMTGSDRPALAAALLPFVLVTVDYAPEARVYGLLTACYALALLFWYEATTANLRRRFFLVGLGCAIALCVLSHFYGVVLIAPLFVAEAVRSLQRRRLDVGVVLSMVVGAATVVLNLPFQRALAPLRKHYYETDAARWQNIPFTYRWFQIHFSAYDALRNSQPVMSVTLVIVVLFFSIMVSRLLRDYREGRPVWVMAALVGTAALPFLNVFVANFTKAYVPRYSLPAVMGLSVLLPVVAYRMEALRDVQIAILGLLFFFGVRYVHERTIVSRLERSAMAAQSAPSPLLMNALSGQADHHIYVQDLAHYLVLSRYADDGTRPYLKGLYSMPCELFWKHRDSGSLFSHSMAETAHVPFAEYDEAFSAPQPRLYVVYHEPDEEWIEDEFKRAGADVVPLGKAFGGDLVRVTVPAGAICE